MPAKHQRRHFSRTGGARTFGLILAAAVLMVFAVVVMIFVARTPASEPGGQALPTSNEPAPDIKQLPGDAQAGGVNSLTGGGNVFARIMAKDDPNRLTGEISTERYEPLEAHRFKLEKPDGWGFLKSGRTVHVQADGGRVYMPDQGGGGRPRDAVLEGHVVIKIFDPLPEGRRPNLAKDVPFGIVTTSVLKFDGELNQLQFPEEFVATSDAGDYTGAGLTLLFNDVDQRLELLHVVQTKKVVVKPGYKLKAPSPEPSAGATQLAGAAPATPALPAGAPGPHPGPAAPDPLRSRPADAPSVESLYHMVCKDHVVAAQNGRTVEAEKLDGWVRLEGNTLRPGAIATSNTPAPAARGKSGVNVAQSAYANGVGHGPGPAVAAIAPESAAPAASPLLPADDSAPITLTWSGPMEVRPLTSAPGELTYNDVFLRFTSEKDGGVKFTDEKTKAHTDGASLLEYGATRREVALASHEPMAAVITLPGSGTGQGQRFEASLVTGLARILGRGTITAEKTASTPTLIIGGSDAGVRDDAPAARSLSWNNQADFQLVLNDKHEVTPVIAEVHASGDTTATDGKGSLAGESLIAQFQPVSPKASRLDHLQVAGQATGEDGRGGTLTSDTLDVAFVPTPGKADQSDPSIVTAQGNVHAHRTDQHGGLNLAASYLQAHIARDDADQLAVTQLDARQSVTFDNADGVHAQAESLSADPVARTAHLTGPPMSVEVSKQGTTITGQDMTLWDLERRLDSRGAGTLVHDGSLTAAPAIQAPKEQDAHVEAAWTNGLVFQDTTGAADCHGDVHATVTKPQRTSPSGETTGPERDIVAAEDVQLTFTPDPAVGKEKPDAPDSAVEGPPAPKAERRLLTILAMGIPGDDSKPAKVESRRYTPSPADQPADEDPVVERILFLQGARINVDNDKGTLGLPNPGKLFVLDSRAASSQPKAVKPDAAALPFDTTSGLRAQSLFTWKGTMSMDRPSGVIHMNDGVEVFQTQDNGDKTRLECQRLTAHVREHPQGDAPKPGPDSISGELTSADAEGAVWLKSGTHEVSASTLHYDAIKKIATLTAADDNIVTISDSKARTQLTSSEKIEWDLARDRVDITKPGTLVAPVDVKKSK